MSAAPKSAPHVSTAQIGLTVQAGWFFAGDGIGVGITENGVLVETMSRKRRPKMTPEIREFVRVVARSAERRFDVTAEEVERDVLGVVQKTFKS